MRWPLWMKNWTPATRAGWRRYDRAGGVRRFAIEPAARVFNIPAGVAFADVLAKGLRRRAGRDPLALAAMTILLPTRRAARAVTDAFLRDSGGQALLLPRLMTLADLDGDQTVLAEDIPPAIDSLQRRLMLARLVMARGGAFRVAPDQALRLADALAELIDAVETAEVDFGGLADLAPEAFASHWQKTVEFLQIVTLHWPAILADRGVVDPARRRRLALDARAARWHGTPPADPVVAAGFIEADPALSRLIAVVARLPNGMVVLPGLDRDGDLDNEAWDAVGVTHPQYGLKRLLEAMAVKRAEVAAWPMEKTDQFQNRAARAGLLSNALRPAETTAAWRGGSPIDPSAIGGIGRIDCATIGEEAEVIALAMRHALETPGRTAGLVTPDRGLARRVAAALRRWNIEVDDSAGRPLAETPVGVWLRLVAEAAVGNFAPRLLLAALKHPLATGGLAPELFRAHVRTLERMVLRGPRPGPGLEGVAAALAQIPVEAFDGGTAGKTALEDWLTGVAACFAPLQSALADREGDFRALLGAHAEVAEALAETPAEPGGLRLWRGQDGEAAADLFARLQGPAGEDLPAFSIDRYPALLTALMAGITVRPLYGAHPRLAIWGLIEARLQRADLTVLSGLNEGSWPPLPGEEPWMSPRMRKDFGLEPLEARIGVAAQDFVLAAAGPEVLLTRAERVDGAPSVPARFLSRLDALLAGSGLGLAAPAIAAWRGWAEAIDDPGGHFPGRRPEPRPPLAARPRRLSVTAIETWKRDPYALYAARILNLRALEPLDADPGAAERGQFIHEALDAFVAEYPKTLPPDGFARLLDAGRAAFGAALAYPSVAAFWWPRFERIAAWFLDFERARRDGGIWPAATEIKGEFAIQTEGQPFVLHARADRIDRLPDGRLAIIDYKTGSPPAVAHVRDGIAPQLPLEAVIAECGGFPGIPPATVGELSFLRLGGGDPPGEITAALGANAVDAAVAQAHEGLVQLIEAFDRPETAYISRPRFDLAFAGDYDHLARIEEWAEAS
jgi:ATP-dependent helicase/nuclease subunit B